jgi:hypothetical protein
MKKKELEEVRKNYLENRNAEIEDFKASLKEVQLDAPSVSGKIAGMDYQQFSALGVFRTIVEQEGYALNKHNSPWVIVEEEKEILADLIKQAKDVFGESYDEWYNHYKGVK